MAIAAILTDIEGTTTDIAFVHQQLFPYSSRLLSAYLHSHKEKPEIAAIIGEIRHLEQRHTAELSEIIAILQRWIAEDRKVTPLKALQGYIWEFGYQSGELQGHLYTDAGEKLTAWQSAGLNLYVYSSGSIKAQKLLFRYSVFGDLSYLFSGFFDTKTGGKKESKSYEKISEITGISPESFLFLSDVAAELEAAQAVGMKTMMLVRDSASESVSFPIARDFTEVEEYWTRLGEFIRLGTPEEILDEDWFPVNH
jgi:enolase-phosphatase E1